MQQNGWIGQRSINIGHERIGRKFYGPTSLLQRKTVTHEQFGFSDIKTILKNTHHTTFGVKCKTGKSTKWFGDVLSAINSVHWFVLTQDVYIEVLRQNLLPFIDILKDDGVGTNLVFQQDNARPHTAHKTNEWLTEMAEEFGFTVMDWPPNSPDLNPIENLWAILKANLVQRYPDTKYLRGRPDTVRSVLKSRLTEIWWGIGPEVLNGLIDSMPHRVEAVLHAKGWYIGY